MRAGLSIILGVLNHALAILDVVPVAMVTDNALAGPSSSKIRDPQVALFDVDLSVVGHGAYIANFL